MIYKSKIKLAALGGLVLSLVSLLVHLLLAKYSNVDITPSAFNGFDGDVPLKLNRQSARFRKLWGSVSTLESLKPYANPRNAYPVPHEQNNGFIYAKIYGGFEKIRSSISDLVTITRLLNATLVIPEIQESTQSKGISSRFKSFSYIYNEDQFIAALAKDIIVVKSLPKSLKEARKRNELPTFKLKSSSTPSFYIKEVLPKLKEVKAIGVVLTDGGCLQSILPLNMDEYQRLRCRVAFHALHFRAEIQALGNRMVARLRGGGQPYIAYHPGLRKETLAYHGCAELFQDIHTELIQYRRKQMVKRGILKEEVNIDSHLRKEDGFCPFMPEEVGLLLRAMGYPPKTIIYLAGSEIFGGQRVLVPLRSMYSNLVDLTSLCSKQELSNVISSETPIPVVPFETPPAKSKKQLKEEWNKAGPRPRPLPPPPDRSIYQHEKEGWYGWVTERDTEPEPSAADLRMQAHRLLWDALDYIVAVEADAFFPGFDNDGSGLPDFSSLVMGHRLYEMASARTYRPDRKVIFDLFNLTRDHVYYPGRNWSLSVQEHLNKSLGEDGLTRESQLSKPISFLAHPLPECSCRTSGYAKIPKAVVDSNKQVLYGGEDECPKWMQNVLPTVSLESVSQKLESDSDTSEDEVDSDEQPEFDDKDSQKDSVQSSEQDEEMDPND